MNLLVVLCMKIGLSLYGNPMCCGDEDKILRRVLGQASTLKANVKLHNFYRHDI
jgi:hypothetical protein